MNDLQGIGQFVLRCCELQASHAIPIIGAAEGARGVLVGSYLVRRVRIRFLRIAMHAYKFEPYHPYYYPYSCSFVCN